LSKRWVYRGSSSSHKGKAFESRWCCGDLFSVMTRAKLRRISSKLFGIKKEGSSFFIVLQIKNVEKNDVK
jgi:hypothetical protein